MTELDVKRCVRRVVTAWCGSSAHPNHKLGSLVPNLTPAQRQRLRSQLHGDPCLAPCSPLVQAAEISAAMTVSALGTRVFRNKQACFGARP